MNLQLEGRHALITGASGGIGRAVAEALADEGAHTAITGRNEKGLADVADSIETTTGKRPNLFVGDLTDDDDVDQLAASVSSAMGKVDILVNCAAAQIQTDLTNISSTDLVTAFQVKLFGPLRLIRELVPHFPTGAAVVMIAGNAAHYPTAGTLVTSAVNAAVLSATRSLADQLAPDVRVVAVSPGPTRTGRWDHLVSSLVGDSEWEAPSMDQILAAQTLTGRVAEPQEVARAVVIAASPAFGLFMGTEILIDGGRTFRGS